MDVFLASPWIPAEWIQAHGLCCHGVWPDLPAGTAAVAGVCSFTRSFQAWVHGHPEAACVFATTCDQMRRAYDELQADRRARCFLFNLPATWQSATARSMFRAEVERLGRFLVGLGGVAPDPRLLADALASSSRKRQILFNCLGEMRAADWANQVREFHWDGSAEPVIPPPAKLTSGIPLAVVGGCMSVEQARILTWVEESGGRVVVNGAEPGERTLLPPCPPEGDLSDPAALMCQHYFDHIVDAYQRPNDPLYRWLRRVLKERAVRGILLWHHYGCDLWRAEAGSLREAFGLPVLVLEAAEGRPCLTRDLGRVQAFLEALR